MERLEILELLADARELDRLAGHRPQAQGGAAAGVAVELGQDGAGDVERLVEMRGHVHRLLAGGGVEHEQDFLRLDQVAQPDQFLHQRFVDLQPAGGVEDERVPFVGARRSRAPRGQCASTSVSPRCDKHRQIELLAERFELVHRRRPINVGRHEQRRAALLLEQAGQLAARGGLARAVQADHQHAARVAAQAQTGVGRAEQFDQFVVDNFDDLLAGLDALDDLLRRWTWP